MAQEFENQALEQMTRDASRALRRGIETHQIIMEMKLKLSATVDSES